MGAVDRHDGFAIPGRVILARELPFDLGPVAVNPPLRELRNGLRRETIEPRVMQVLVALARAGGEIVTREDLTESCWNGRIVGDDSINRVLSRIRRIGAGIGEGRFVVETIARVGYRLTAEPNELAPAIPAGAAPPAAPPMQRRMLLKGFGALSGLAAAGAGVWWLVPRGEEPRALARLYYRRGMEARGQNALSQNEQAVAYFRQATRADPDYADAWGALAWGYRALLEFGPRSDDAHITTLARSAADRALALDGDNADAQAAVLLLRPFYRNWADIEPGLGKLLARHPDHSITRFNLGHVLSETGRWGESIPHFQRLAEREPFWPLARMQLFRALFASDRFEEAEHEIEEALSLWPRRYGIWSTRLRQMLLTGRAAEALAFIEHEPGLPLDSDAMIDLDRLVTRAFVSGSASQRGQALERVLKQVTATPPNPVWAALDCCLLGEIDRAFAVLEGYFFGRGPWAGARSQRPTTGFLFNRTTAPLRRDRRFAPLLEEIGLPTFWRQTGTQPDFLRLA